MLRTMITIDEEKCNGCGACAQACHEGAIAMVGGKARLIRDAYCDGLGDCLPACPTGAITFETREAEPYDEQAVQQRLQQRAAGGGCPGSQARRLTHETAPAADPGECPSCLAQWPAQIKLVPPSATYFDGAPLLIAADCTAYAYGGFHQAFMRGCITLIGCPKLDSIDYADKLTDILTLHDIPRVTVTRMQVPCCGGLESAVARAIAGSGKRIPCQVVTISTDGRILSTTDI